MASFKHDMQEKLAHALTEEEKGFLPTGFQRLGHIAIIKLKPELLEKKTIIGEAVLTVVSGVKTVCLNTGQIAGEYRQPQIEYLAGENQVSVTHTEHGCVFRFDVTKLMWSQGNMSERKRMYENVKAGETVVDFFCGMGYWSIPIAKHARPKHVYAIDKNPDAIFAIRENQHLNHISNETLTIIEGNCTEEAGKLGRIADRIILGYIPAPSFALPAAFHVIKLGGGIIHYEGVCAENAYEELVNEVKEVGMQYGYSCALQHAQPVKSYGPKKWHYTLDIKVERIN